MPQIRILETNGKIQGETNEKYQFFDEENRKIHFYETLHLLPASSHNQNAAQEHGEQSQQERQPAKRQQVVAAQKPCEPGDEQYAEGLGKSISTVRKPAECHEGKGKGERADSPDHENPEQDWEAIGQVIRMEDVRPGSAGTIRSQLCGRHVELSA